MRVRWRSSLLDAVTHFGSSESRYPENPAFVRPHVAEELHVAGVDASAWYRVFRLQLSPCSFIITISYTV